MHCCDPRSHARTIDDQRFEDDDFTQAALHERRVRAAHAHGLALALSAVGAMLFVGLAKKCCASRR